jgi:hypothetical protein
VLLALRAADLVPARTWAYAIDRQLVLELLADGASRTGADYISAAIDGKILARLCLADGEYAEAARVAGLLAEASARREYLIDEVDYRALEARALDAVGKAAEARQAAEQALARAAPAGLIGPFLGEGEGMARLVYEASAGGPHARFAGRVLAAFPAREASRASWRSCASWPGDSPTRRSPTGCSSRRRP